VKNATKACELSDWKNYEHLCTLAAACAEAGDFENAVKWQQKAIELAREETKDDYGARRDLYKIR
jgi:serine/threonine-protein kinase